MHWGFVIAGYVIVFTTLAAYISWVLFRGRELTKRVPPERRRYLDSESAPASVAARASVSAENPAAAEDSESGRDSGVAP